MTPARLLDAQPGERVLDLCAAPGGKTTQLAAAMQGLGLLVCNEIHPRRAQVLASNIERLGIPNALVLSEHPAKLAQRFPGYFDRILVDAPCSGEGMFRKEGGRRRTGARRPWPCAPRGSRRSSPPQPKCWPPRRTARLFHLHVLARGKRGRHLRLSARASGVFRRAGRGSLVSPARPDWIDDPAPGLEHAFRLWPHCLRGEGHFAAVLRSHADGTRQDVPTERPAQLPAAAADFLRSCTQPLPDGVPVCFGSVCYLAPAETPALFRPARAARRSGSLVNCAVTASPRPRAGALAAHLPADGGFPGRRRRSPPICAARRCTARSAAGRC